VGSNINGGKDPAGKAKDRTNKSLILLNPIGYTAGRCLQAILEV